MRALILALALLCGPAIAEDAVARNGKDAIRITDAPCPASILALTPEGTRGFFRAAFAVLDGKSWDACWALLNDGRILLLYSDGDQGMVSSQMFKPEAGI